MSDAPEKKRGGVLMDFLRAFITEAIILGLVIAVLFWWLS